MTEQSVTLNPGESKVVSFEAVPSEAKTYQVSVNGLTGSFLAKAAPTGVSLYLYPIAPGDWTQISGGQYPSSGAHWDKVDDPYDSPDDDATYVFQIGFSNTVFLSDLFKLTAPTGSGVINYIRVRGRFKCANPYAGSSNSIMVPEIKIGGVLYDYSYDSYYGRQKGTPGGVWYTGNATEYVEGWIDFATNPKTGLPWTWADLANLQAGVRLYGAFSATETRCTQVYVEVKPG